MMNKKHFRRLLACVALCLFAVLAKAENYSFTLVINGESYVFNLAEKPVITYEGDKLNVKVTEPSTVVEEQSTVREISVPVVEIQNIDLEKVNVVDEEGAGVKDATTKTSFADGQLQMEQAASKAQVKNVEVQLADAEKQLAAVSASMEIFANKEEVAALKAMMAEEVAKVQAMGEQNNDILHAKTDAIADEVKASREYLLKITNDIVTELRLFEEFVQVNMPFNESFEQWKEKQQ